MLYWNRNKFLDRFAASFNTKRIRYFWLWCESDKKLTERAVSKWLTPIFTATCADIQNQLIAHMPFGRSVMEKIFEQTKPVGVSTEAVQVDLDEAYQKIVGEKSDGASLPREKLPEVGPAKDADVLPPLGLGPEELAEWCLANVSPRTGS